MARPDRLGGPALIYPRNRVRKTPLATHPKVAIIAREVRDRTQKALRNASSYEASRH